MEIQGSHNSDFVPDCNDTVYSVFRNHNYFPKPFWSQVFNPNHDSNYYCDRLLDFHLFKETLVMAFFVFYFSSKRSFLVVSRESKSRLGCDNNALEFL